MGIVKISLGSAQVTPAPTPPPIPPTPKRGRAVPATSKDALAAVTASGQRSGQKAVLLAWVRAHCNTSSYALTAREIAKNSYLSHEMIHKRLPELVRSGQLQKGSPRPCNVTGLSAVTWYAA